MKTREILRAFWLCLLTGPLAAAPQPPADLARRRDVVLAKALGLLKQRVSPEEAYRLFPRYADEDDEY